jgi:hypothetical protein
MPYPDVRLSPSATIFNASATRVGAVAAETRSEHAALALNATAKLRITSLGMRAAEYDSPAR